MPTPLTAILQLPLLPPEAKIRGVVIHRRRCVPPDFRRYLQRERSAPSGHPEKQPPGERGSPQHPPPHWPHTSAGDPQTLPMGPTPRWETPAPTQGAPQNLPMDTTLRWGTPKISL